MIMRPCTAEEVFQASRELWELWLPVLLKDGDEYRQGLIEEHRKATAVLGDGFWYYVFITGRRSGATSWSGTSPVATRRQRYFAEAAKRARHGARLLPVPPHGLLPLAPGAHAMVRVLGRLPGTEQRHGRVVKAAEEEARRPAVAILYDRRRSRARQTRQRRLQRGPGGRRQADEEVCFNPVKGNSIACKPMPRDTLEKWLEEKGLLGKGGKLFSPCWMRCTPAWSWSNKSYWVQRLQQFIILRLNPEAICEAGTLSREGSTAGAQRTGVNKWTHSRGRPPPSCKSSWSASSFVDPSIRLYLLGSDWVHLGGTCIVFSTILLIIEAHVLSQLDIDMSNGCHNVVVVIRGLPKFRWYHTAFLKIDHKTQ